MNSNQSKKTNTRDKIFKISLMSIGIAFTIIFFILMTPPFLDNPDILGVFAAGFVNPYAAGYSTDVIFCWIVLFVWVVYEYPKIKNGWLCLLIGIVPGVAVGFALYLILRTNYLINQKKAPQLNKMNLTEG